MKLDYLHVKHRTGFGLAACRPLALCAVLCISLGIGLSSCAVLGGSSAGSGAANEGLKAGSGNTQANFGNTQASSGNTQAGSESIRVSSVWDPGKHCAFTSLIKFQDHYYLAFRESGGHVFDSDGIARGKIRILTSTDGEKWVPCALLAKEGMDLRDPSLSITPDGRILVSMGGSVYVDKKLVRCTPMYAFSSDGKAFSAPEKAVLEWRTDASKGNSGAGSEENSGAGSRDNSGAGTVQVNSGAGSEENSGAGSTSTGDTNTRDWIWKVDWAKDGTGYGVNYFFRTDGQSEVSLVRTTDGIHYSIVTKFDIGNKPNEAAVHFLPDGRMVMLLRQEVGNNGLIGVSSAPYTEWKFTQTGTRLGGPNFVVTGEDSFIAGSRTKIYTNLESLKAGSGASGSGTSTSGAATSSQERTALFTGRIEKSILAPGGAGTKLQRVCVLPSLGDTSYTGLLIVGDELWVSYYSGVETDPSTRSHTAIYLAKMPLSLFK